MDCFAMIDMMENKYAKWEDILLPSLLSNIKKISENLYEDNNKVFFDIGANVGLITEHLHLLHPTWKFYLFEPVYDYYIHCCDKFKNYPNIRIFNIAFSNFNGETFISKCSDNLGWNTISTIKDYGTKEKITAQTLDSFLISNKIEEIGFMKIDVEQYESYVIEGGKDFFTNCKKLPKLLIEVGAKDSHPCWLSVCEMFEFLFKIGYKRFDYSSNNSTNDILLTT